MAHFNYCSPDIIILRKNKQLLEIKLFETVILLQAAASL